MIVNKVAPMLPFYNFVPDKVEQCRFKGSVVSVPPPSWVLFPRYIMSSLRGCERPTAWKSLFSTIWETLRIEGFLDVDKYVRQRLAVVHDVIHYRT